MATVDIKRRIDEQLDQLPPEMQRRVLDFVQALVVSRPKGVPGSSLMRFAGILSDEDAASMMQAIEADCERVDANGW